MSVAVADKVPTVADKLAEREAILREISELEARIEGLKSSLPLAFKTLWLFRCQPERKVYVYADLQEEATRKLHARMNRQYQKTKDGWNMASKVVQAMDAEEMASQTPNNFLTSLTRPDALEFLVHWNANRTGLPEKPKDAVLTRVERDVRDFERWIKTENCGSFR